MASVVCYFLRRGRTREERLLSHRSLGSCSHRDQGNGQTMVLADQLFEDPVAFEMRQLLTTASYFDNLYRYNHTRKAANRVQ